MVRLIDSHCHLNFDAFDADREAMMARADEAGITAIVIPAVDEATAQQAIDLAARDRRVFASSGIHPNSTADFAEAAIAAQRLAAVERLAGAPRVVAIGEIGLDYHWEDSPHEVQARAFEAQLAIAARLELPVIIHNREASDDTLRILERWARDLPSSLRDRPGVLHSFSADESIARRALDIGFYLGFTGPITYKNADDLRRIAAWIPLDRLLIETDAPYLTPTPHRGKRNEPAYVRLVAERLASLRLSTLDAIAEATTANAARLFRLTLP